MNLDLADDDVKHLIQVCDRNDSGCITAKEFLKTLAVVDMQVNPFGPGSREREIASLERISNSPVPQSGEGVEEPPWPLNTIDAVGGSGKGGGGGGGVPPPPQRDSNASERSTDHEPVV